ncbi:respiratory nitrate reductase subunit gamma [Streptomyces dysideae]|uniref:respiratory nitrate reductase subunit gamma n=1 Tax=Streptomyces dysideae TaxID=909626 RepID=UPI000B185A80|nr:respiratory nitrate reductase subunit gamma [Streptomyces dysideae]
MLLHLGVGPSTVAVVISRANSAMRATSPSWWAGRRWLIRRTTSSCSWVSSSIVSRAWQPQYSHITGLRIWSSPIGYLARPYLVYRKRAKPAAAPTSASRTRSASGSR